MKIPISSIVNFYISLLETYVHIYHTNVQCKGISNRQATYVKIKGE